MAARTEADAVILKFFSKDELEMPETAVAAFMQEFRDFRAELDREVVEHSSEDPEAQEG